MGHYLFFVAQNAWGTPTIPFPDDSAAIGPPLDGDLVSVIMGIADEVLCPLVLRVPWSFADVTVRDQVCEYAITFSPHQVLSCLR